MLGSLLAGWGLVQHSARLEEEMALGKEGCFSIQAWTDSCLNVFSSCLFLKAFEAEDFGAYGMRCPQLLLPTDLTKTSNPRPEQTVLIC